MHLTYVGNRSYSFHCRLLSSPIFHFLPQTLMSHKRMKNNTKLTHELGAGSVLQLTNSSVSLLTLYLNPVSLVQVTDLFRLPRKKLEDPKLHGLATGCPHTPQTDHRFSVQPVDADLSHLLVIMTLCSCSPDKTDYHNMKTFPFSQNHIYPH